MTRLFTFLGVLCLTTVVLAQPTAFNQPPKIGYAYPAGGQRGTTFEVVVGGQFLDDCSGAVLSGGPATIAIVDHFKPLNNGQAAQLNNKLREAREKMADDPRGRRALLQLGRLMAQGKRGSLEASVLFESVAERAGVTVDQLEALRDFREKRNDPKRQLNPQIAETITLEVTLPEDAAAGTRELRLRTPLGTSNPVKFHVGRYLERRESEPNDDDADLIVRAGAPIVINGQVMPGDVDRFCFSAKRDERLVVAVSARELIPYLADAVPGWFQATLALYDEEGREIAFVDDHRFQPDPVLYYEIPATGKYSLEIRDALYRGREDFVYRVALGEIPYVTSLFPLGTGQGEPAEVTATGWNLPADRWTSTGSAPAWAHNGAALAIDDWPAMLEVEPNDQPDSAQKLTTPVVVDGRVDRPGDWDVYCFEAKSGETIIAETLARRLGSPIDSVIELIDAAGQRFAANDDSPDKAAALTTHHADSRFLTTLPRDGVYFLRIGDAQSQGGDDCAYRLRVGPPRPDFALRVTPSNVNVPVGAVAKVTVHALRRDGFSGAIELDLIDAPQGFALDGAVIPPGKDSIRMTLAAPRVAPEDAVPLELVGRAAIDGQLVQHPVEAAEDMTQAFIYHHLVPADQLLATVVRRRFSPPPVKIVNDGIVDVPIGGSVTIRAFSPFRRGLGGEAFFTLDAPPAGLRVSKPMPNPTGFTFTLSADETAEPDLRDNLIIDAFVKRTFQRQDGTSQTRDAPIGSLPAIPIRIVKPSL